MHSSITATCAIKTHNSHKPYYTTSTKLYTEGK